MLLSLLFPFADSRRFLTDAAVLASPNWPLPQVDTEFVRCFGPIRRRQGGGLDTWVGENEVCRADRALQFVTSPSYQDSQNAGLRLTLRCAYRRLFFEGDALGKFEIGLATKSRAVFQLEAAPFERFLQHMLNAPVRVRDTPRDTPSPTCKLREAGKHITQLYSTATAAKAVPPHVKMPQPWWVRAGTPLLFLSHEPGQLITLPAKARPVSLPVQLGFSLHTLNVTVGGTSLPMLCLSLAPGGDADKARLLRLYLTRLYAEHECLRLVLDAIRTQKIVVTRGTAESDQLQHYLDEATDRIQELEGKSAQSFDAEVIEVARRSLGNIIPGHRQQLLEQLKTLDLRRYIRRDVTQFLDSDIRAGILLALRDLLGGYRMELDNLKAVCLALNIDWEQLGGENANKKTKADELIQFVLTLDQTAPNPLVTLVAQPAHGHLIRMLEALKHASVRPDLQPDVDALVTQIQQWQ